MPRKSTASSSSRKAEKEEAAAAAALSPLVLSLLHHGDGIEALLQLCSKLPSEVGDNYRELRYLDSQSQALIRDLHNVQSEVLDSAKRGFWEALIPGDLDNLVLPQLMEAVHLKREEIEHKLAEKVSIPVKAYDAVDQCIISIDECKARWEKDILQRTGEAPLPPITAPPPPPAAVRTSKSSHRKKGSSKRGASAAAKGVSVMPEVNPNEPLYCLCQKGQSGEMVACDNEECSIEWFHYACVGIKEAPEEWYCPLCGGPDPVGDALEKAKMAAEQAANMKKKAGSRVGAGGSASTAMDVG